MFQATDKGIVNEINPVEKIDIKVESEEFCLTNDEEIVNEMNPTNKMNIKVESEEFCRMNDVQGNYDGVTSLIILVDILCIFYCCFYASFQY